MKKTILYALFILFICSFLCSQTTLNSSINALTLWFETLVPSFLFPLIFVRILTPYHLLQPILKCFDRLFIIIFRINANAMECILTSLFLGFPSSSLYLEEYAKENHFTTKQYQRLLGSVFMCSPNFILLSLSVIYPTSITYTLLGIQLLCISIMLLTSRKTPLLLQPPTQKVAFFPQLKCAITKSFETLLMILAFLTIVYVLIDLVSLFFPLIIKTPLKLLSEFSSGCFYLSSLPISIHAQHLFISMVLSYGGLCVHMQIISMVDKRYFSYLSFMKYRLLHIVLSCVFTYLLWW